MSRVWIGCLALAACAVRQPGTIEDPSGAGWATYSQGSVRTDVQSASINYYAYGYIPLSFVVVDVPETTAVYPGRGSLTVPDEVPTCTHVRTVAECALDTAGAQ